MILAIFFRSLVLITSHILFIQVPFILNNFSKSDIINFLEEISPISNFIFPLLGLILGFVYYFHKLKSEEKNRNIEVHRQRIKLLLNYLEKYDEYVSQILYREFKSNEELKILRDKVRRAFFDIENIINLSVSESNLSEKNVDTILNVHTFVDKSPTIMEKPLEKFNNGEISNEHVIYNRKMKLARKTCVLSEKFIANT